MFLNGILPMRPISSLVNFWEFTYGLLSLRWDTEEVNFLEGPLPLLGPTV